MIIKKLIILLLVWGVVFSSSVQAATCSCAGVPLSNSINLMGLEAGQYEVGYSYTYSDISDLVAGSKDINDETGRERKTDSHLLQTTYGISDNWAVTGVISWIEHTRNISTSNTADEDSAGVGDSLVVFSYAPQKIDPFSRNEWAFGVGVRVPTGEEENGNPIIFAEDLQPGQGAWGSSFWLHYGHAFNQQADWVYFVDANIAKSGSNDRDYSFEGEWNLTSGINYVSSSNWSSSLAINYRNAQRHTRFGGDIPNTGGEWYDFIPSVTYSVSPTLSVGITARLPIYRDLNDSLQFSTKQSFSLSVTYLID
mgnify:CR=1 FL=1